MKRRNLLRTVWSLMLVATVISFQNCAPAFKARDLGAEFSSLNSNAPAYKMPEIKFKEVPRILTNKRQQVYALELTIDPSAKVKYVHCRLDNLTTFDCANLSWTIPDLSEGDHVLSLEVEDSNGNRSAQISAVVRVDTTPPVVNFSQKPAAVIATQSTTFSFMSMDTMSGVDTLECSLDSTNFANCTSPLSLNSLTIGEHNFRIRAKDKAGNVSAVQSASWKVDLSAIGVQITSRPSAVSNSTSASIAFSGSAPTAAAVTFECILDSGAFSACSSPSSQSNLAQGSRKFQVRAKSGSAMSAPAEASWVVDTIAPTVPVITSSTASLSNQTSVSFSFLATDATTSVKSFLCSLDSAPFSVCVSPQMSSGLNAGTHSFSVKAVDEAGNVSAAAKFDWSVDTSIDLQLSEMPAAMSELTSARFIFSTTEPSISLASLKCQLDASTPADCTSPKEYSGLANGNHVFRVTVLDRAGNTKTVSHSWAIGQTPVADGAALYSTQCAACHGAIGSSTKKGKTVSAITNAIRDIAMMSSRPGLIALSQAELKAIEAALNPTASSGGDAGSPVGQCLATAVRGASKEAVRRLTRSELKASVLSILPELATDLTPNFDYYSEGDLVEDVDRFSPLFSSSQVLQWAELIDKMADAVFKRSLRNKLGGSCFQQATIDETCWKNFYTTFGKKVYRRPLLTEEVNKLTSLSMRASGAENQIYLALHMLFRSPAFLFHYEIGMSEESNRARLSDYEVANRLSFALIGAPPDTTLFAAAESGQLKTLAQVEAHARRLIETPQAKPKLEKFFVEWLQLDKVQSPQNEFMAFFKQLGTSAGVDRAMRQEVLDYLFYVILKKKGTFVDVMTQPIAFPRFQGLDYGNNSKPFSAVAAVYGDSKYTNFTPERQEEAMPFAAPGNPGLLMRAGLLVTSRWDTEPIARGVFIQRRILCENLPSPDFSVVNSRLEDVGAIDPLKVSNHGRVTAQTSGAACISCHSKINPIGFALESYDMMGKVRLKQDVLDINQFYSEKKGIVASFPLPGPIHNVLIGEKTVTVSNPSELAQHVSTSSRARSCLSTFVLRHYDRRHENSGDSCAISEAVKVMDENKPVLDVFIKTIANDDIFWRRK